MTTANNSSLFLNRELSWLEFNRRVLEEATFEDTPLLERIKFLTIFISNLDEFFMVRVAGLKKIFQEDLPAPESADGLSTEEVLRKIREKVTELYTQHNQIFFGSILPKLAQNKLHLKKWADLQEEQRQNLTLYFNEQVYPILTPLAVDQAHPFPFLSNLSLYFVVVLTTEAHTPQGSPLHANSNQHLLGLIELPSMVPRLVPVPTTTSESGDKEYILLEDLMREHLSGLFYGFKIDTSFQIRVTRNLDYTLLENEVVDLIKTIQREVIKREHQEAVRLEAEEGIPQPVLEHLLSALNLTEQDVYLIKPPIFTVGMKELYNQPLKELKDTPFNPRLPKILEGSEDFFSILSEEDILVHHPFESFYAFIEFINSAAQDPNVVAIKQTLYRVSGDSPIIDALINAAENGKNVTAVIELKARFDEKNNIQWARRLERAGVNVVFGFVGLKTHAKMTMIVRKEKNNLVRYTHLSTGNYNPLTAKLYTDLSLFTANQDIGQDVASLFNLLTGFNIMTGEHMFSPKQRLPKFKKLAVAPLTLRKTFLELVAREIDLHQKHGGGEIIAKVNSLVDKAIIESLYAASQVGVKIQLIVRGMCCLKPGIPGLSDNIRVVSIIDKFLEHSRIFYFRAHGKDDVYLSSADWMSRNLDRRIEIYFLLSKIKSKEELLTKF